MKRLDFLELAVAKMRALGVTRWNGIELGPDPHTKPEPVSEEERARRLEAFLRKQHEILFAASSVKPPFPGVQGNPMGPKSVAPRVIAHGRRNAVPNQG